MADVDVLIVDASYTEEEYPAKMGWGHGTYQAAIEQAAAAHTGQLIFTHHEPGRSDAQLDAIFAEISTRHGGSGIRITWPGKECRSIFEAAVRSFFSRRQIPASRPGLHGFRRYRFF